MTITPTDAVAGVAVGFAFFAYWVFRPRRSTEQPGPHNNWERTDWGDDGSSFNESGAGFGSGGDGGHD